MDAPTAPIPLALAPLPSSNRVLPPPQVPLHVGFVGTGLIGKATLKQVGAHAPSLLATGGLDLRIAACADSKHMILASSASSSRRGTRASAQRRRRLRVYTPA